jgi:hypothetical protein
MPEVPQEDSPQQFITLPPIAATKMEPACTSPELEDVYRSQQLRRS